MAPWSDRPHIVLPGHGTACTVAVSCSATIRVRSDVQLAETDMFISSCTGFHHFPSSIRAANMRVIGNMA
jgi:hypothetical protein